MKHAIVLLAFAAVSAAAGTGGRALGDFRLRRECVYDHPGLLRATYEDPCQPSQVLWCGTKDLPYFETEKAGSGWSAAGESPSEFLATGFRQNPNPTQPSRYLPQSVAFKGFIWNRTDHDVTMRVACCFYVRLTIGLDLNRTGVLTWAWHNAGAVGLQTSKWEPNAVNFCTFTLRPGATPIRLLALGSSYNEDAKPPSKANWPWALSYCTDPEKVAAGTTAAEDFREMSDGGTGALFTTDEDAAAPRRSGGFAFVLRAAPPPPPITYRTVTFRRLNGTVLDRVAVADGAGLAAPEGPAETDMRFVGWDGAERLSRVTEDMDVWALYEATSAKEPSTKIASKSIAARATPYSLEEYFQLYDHLAWSDEFSGDKLDVGQKFLSSYRGGTWNYDMEQRNGELHKHVESCATVSDGCLRITTRRKTNGGYQFEGGGVTTKGKVAFTFGRCEIRAKLCRGLGVWPAFWFMGSTGGWPACGEIDALEQLNGGEWIASTLHMPDPAVQYSTIQTQATCGPTDGVHWGDGFHRFGVIVNAREIVFYTDGMIHERIDVTDSRYAFLRDRAQFILMGSGMGGAWSGITDATQVPAGFQSEDYVIDSCRIFTNETEGRTVARTPSDAALSAPVSATAWKGWSMSWGKSGAGAYQNDITTNGFTEAFYVNCALNGHVDRDRPDVVFFLTEPACMTGADSGAKNFWTNLQLKAEGMLVSRPRRLGDSRHEALCAAILYDGRRFSATESVCAALPFADAAYTNATVVCAELVERKTGASVRVYGVNSVCATAAELAPLVAQLNASAGDRAIVLLQGLNATAYQGLVSAAAGLGSSYQMLGEDKSGYRRAYASGAGSAAKPAPLTIVDPKRPTRVSSHPMQALQATVTFP